MPSEDLHGTVILASDGDTALLDHALRARCVPALGLSASSPWRGALQVLPLAFAAAWQPFDPRVLLNLFLLPRPPVAAWVARRLARALSEEPGVGGRAWREAWAQIEERSLEINTQSDADIARRKTDTTLAEWRAWTEVGRFARGEGMPLSEALKRPTAPADRPDKGDRGEERGGEKQGCQQHDAENVQRRDERRYRLQEACQCLVAGGEEEEIGGHQPPGRAAETGEPDKACERNAHGEQNKQRLQYVEPAREQLPAGDSVFMHACVFMHAHILVPALAGVSAIGTRRRAVRTVVLMEKGSKTQRCGEGPFARQARAIYEGGSEPPACEPSMPTINGDTP